MVRQREGWKRGEKERQGKRGSEEERDESLARIYHVQYVCF